MARKCACEKLLDLVEQDPRFVLAGPAASMVFLRLVRMMARIGDTQVLRLGFLFGSWSELAFGLRITETELETQLQTLAARGVIERDDTSITLPEWLGLRDRRAEAARANGAKGGRPRKTGPDPRQTNILYPLPGGASAAAGDETQETKTETQEENVLSSGSTTSFSERESSSEGVTRDPPWVLLGRELASILQLDPMGKHRFDIVKGWLENGASATWIKDVFLEVMNRKSPPPHPSFSYLDKVIRPRLRTRSPSVSAPETAVAITKEQRAREAEWDGIFERWKCDGFNGRPIPKRRDWIFGEVGERARWLLYPRMGDAVFRDVA